MSIVGIIALVVTALWLVGIGWMIDDWGRDLSINYANIEIGASDPGLESPILKVSPQEAADLVRNWVETQSKWTLASVDEEDDAVVAMHLIRTTPLFRFKDDVRIRLAPEAHGTRLTAESRSRVGKGDLGQNPRNLKELLRVLEEKRAAGNQI